VLATGWQAQLLPARSSIDQDSVDPLIRFSGYDTKLRVYLIGVDVEQTAYFINEWCRASVSELQHHSIHIQLPRLSHRFYRHSSHQIGSIKKPCRPSHRVLTTRDDCAQELTS
jgi:hypothetical protein